jgi:hypothetical protein
MFASFAVASDRDIVDLNESFIRFGLKSRDAAHILGHETVINLCSSSGLTMTQEVALVLKASLKNVNESNIA